MRELWKPIKKYKKGISFINQTKQQKYIKKKQEILMKIKCFLLVLYKKNVLKNNLFIIIKDKILKDI